MRLIGGGSNGWHMSTGFFEAALLGKLIESRTFRKGVFTPRFHRVDLPTDNPVVGTVVDEEPSLTARQSPQRDEQGGEHREVDRNEHPHQIGPRGSYRPLDQRERLSGPRRVNRETAPYGE